MTKSPINFGPLIGFALLLSPVCQAQNETDASAAAAAYRAGYNLILDRDWSGALAKFGELVEQHGRSDWVDDAEFWRCYARDELGEAPDQVFACYENHLANYRRSEWNDDARRAMVRLARRLDREGRSGYKDRVREFGRSDDDNQMLRVLIALAEIGDERSLDIILERLDATTDEHLRARIADVLEDIESPRATAKLEQLIQSDPSEKVRRQALHALSHHKDAALPTLLAVYRDPQQNSRMRAEALDYLAELEPADLMTILREAARGADQQVALRAIDEISDREDRESLDILIELLGAVPDQRRRIAIVDEIEDYDIADAANALLEVAKSDPDPRVRRAATDALGDMESVAAREALIELLRTLNEDE